MATEPDIDKFDRLKRVASEFHSLGNSYVYIRLKDPESPYFLDGNPRKNEGMTMLLVKEGEIDVEINLQRFTIGSNSFVVLPHGVTINHFGYDNPKLDAYMLCFSTEFLHSVNINFTAISLGIPTFVERQSPAQELSDAECTLMLKYFELLKINAISGVNELIENNIASSLMAAMVYQLVQIHYKRIGLNSSSKGQRSCRNAYVHDFIKLVHVHYSRERSVSFYADKLCISPKYLSLLVKETTGKSAARWIDEFVLMEAKNLLRFSGKNVQQVAYALNFTNQSSFGKYFKHMTGQSPTEYQKS